MNGESWTVQNHALSNGADSSGSELGWVFATCWQDTDLPSSDYPAEWISVKGVA